MAEAAAQLDATMERARPRARRRSRECDYGLEN
jgi:hypothetical protein